MTPTRRRKSRRSLVVLAIGAMLILVAGGAALWWRHPAEGEDLRTAPVANNLGSIKTPGGLQGQMREIIVYFGLLSLYNDYRLELGDVAMIYWVMMAMAGSIMISYTRARAEALGVPCTVGLMQRPERVLLIGSSALLFGEMNQGIVLKAVIIVLAILTNLTVLQRILWVYRHTRPSKLDGVQLASEETDGEPTSDPGVDAPGTAT